MLDSHDARPDIGVEAPHPVVGIVEHRRLLVYVGQRERNDEGCRGSRTAACRAVLVSAKRTPARRQQVGCGGLEWAVTSLITATDEAGVSMSDTVAEVYAFFTYPSGADQATLA